jgi:eukaryotic-like serine/threonine-protein kinase
MTDSQRWVLVKLLFGRAAELPPGERAAFLEREAGGDEELRAQVQSLLDADGDASDFLEAGPSSLLAGLGPGGPDRWMGRRLGPYEVVGELGRGGMGVVLLGRRADGRYQREVALKVVPASLVQGHLESRFRTEVRILAELDHPNVARLLDAGETDEGLAYLVMEYVDGPRIDVFADQNSLDVKARLQLFRKVLDGVDYAHSRGVIHRDLKPSNILVTRDGVPKLVDFGIAKLLEPVGEETVLLTRTSQRLLTPEFASPEQVRGGAVDPRSDVYSLGVVLYRLLTGRPPYVLDATQPRAVEQVICEETPSRPSDAVTRTVAIDPEATHPAADPDILARQRSSTRDRLQRSLRGDLDTIVLHALAKEPQRRYATAGAFADDIDRHLDGEVIRARDPGTLYRTRRFLRRRWVPLAASAALLAGVSAVVSQVQEVAVQRQVAEASSAELTSLVASVLNSLNTDMAGQDQGPTATRAAAVEAAVASLDSLAARAKGPPSPELLSALAYAYQDVGMIQGHPMSANLGRIVDAQASFETSLELWARLIAARPDNLPARLEAVETRVLLADIHRMRGDNAQAAVLLQAAEAAVDSLDGPEEELGALSVRAMVYERQAHQAEGRGDLVTATEYARLTTGLARRVAELAPEEQSMGALEEIVLSLQTESFLNSKAARHDAAIAAQLRAALLADSLVQLPGATQRMLGIQAGAWHQLGWRYNDADRPDEAEEPFTRAIGMGREISRSDPRNVGALLVLGQILEGRGQARIRGERWEPALEDHTEAIEILTPILEGLPATLFVVAQAHRQRGEALSRLERWPEAEEEYDEAVAMAEGLLRSDTTFAPARKILALAHLSRALHHRLRVSATGDAGFCGPAGGSEELAWSYWTPLRERGQTAPGEEAVWTDFLDMMPRGICGEG